MPADRDGMKALALLRGSNGRDLGTPLAAVERVEALQASRVFLMCRAARGLYAEWAGDYRRHCYPPDAWVDLWRSEVERVRQLEEALDVRAQAFVSAAAYTLPEVEALAGALLDVYVKRLALRRPALGQMPELLLVEARSTTENEAPHRGPDRHRRAPRRGPVSQLSFEEARRRRVLAGVEAPRAEDARWLPAATRPRATEAAMTPRDDRATKLRERVWRLLRRHPEGLRAVQVRERLQCGHAQVAKALDTLRHEKRVRREQTGNEIRYFAVTRTLPKSAL